VIHWLEQGAGVPGYVGFAIGRTIWSDPLKAHVDGERSREDAAQAISANYRKMIDVYTSAAER
jgi:5-dehydro-2-deoxygluconokinase